jgi:tripartite-type tricarboxylate transporter receptor subunit TctC
MSQRSAFARALAALALGLAAAATTAQDYPNRPVKIIAPNPPGGGFDFFGRVAAERLSAQLGQQFIVENRVGSGTVVGTTAAARAAPDGYTLLVGALSNIALNPGLYKELAYDPLADFTPVGLIATYSYTLVGRKDLPQATLREIVEYARTNPGKINFAVGGPGTGQQIGAAILAKLTATSFHFVPYKGAGAVYPDLLAGRVDLFYDLTGTARPYIEAGQVKGIAASSAQRNPLLPNVPTINESGVATLEMETWFGLFAPAKTPAAILDRLRAETAKVVEHPEVAARFEKATARVVRMSPAETDAYVKSEVAKWTKLVREAGITAE